MKKYLFVYDVQTNTGAQGTGNSTADLKALTYEAVVAVRDSIKRNTPGAANVIITNIIELEG